MICGFLLATVAQAGACVEVPSDRVVASQLVDAVPVLRQLAPGTSLGFAPLPGLVRVISGRELSLIALRDGVILSDAPDVCIGRVLRPITSSEMQAELQAALGMPEAELTVEDFSSQPLPPGRLEFQRSTLTQPPPNAPASPVFWRGRLIYDQHHGVPVSANQDPGGSHRIPCRETSRPAPCSAKGTFKFRRCANSRSEHPRGSRRRN